MKRFFDLLLGFVILFLLATPMLLIAIATRLTSKGLILYWSDRVGINNEIFKMPKFRSMLTDAPDVATHLLKNPDVYLSPIGGFLRRSSLDELPQLFSVLKGDMSFVGPRPPVSYELGNYDDFDDRLKSCFTVKPGVTGLAQVKGRNELSWDEKIHLNLQYIRTYNKWGLLYDAKLLLLTICKVVRNEGSHELAKNSEKDKRHAKSKQ